MMLLQIKDIRVRYGTLEAVKGVSIAVEEGSIVSVIGPNGAGKTTLLKTISGLKRPTAGEIWFEGRRIDRLPPEKVVRMGIAHVPEGRRIFPYMSVLENLMMGAFVHKNPEQISRGLQNVYGHFPILKDRSRQSGGSLSGGEQQMLAIGRALMSKPKLILMDEPTLGLAPLMIREIGKVIGEINRGGVSILLVEQNASLALSLAIKCYVLEIGKIALEGDPAHLSVDDRVRKVYLGAH